MASQKYNILYGRLSQEDERQRDDRQKESNSIHNQKLFLEQYAADHGFENTLFLADDTRNSAIAGLVWLVGFGGFSMLRERYRSRDLKAALEHKE